MALALVVSALAVACGSERRAAPPAPAIPLNLDVPFVPGELVVSLPAPRDPGRPESCRDPERIAFLDSLGFDLVREYKLIRACRVRLRAALGPDLLRSKAQRIESRPELFGRAEANHIARLEQGSTPDPWRGEQWGLDDIAAESAWLVTRGSAGIRVAIVDTGIDYTHPDLQENVWNNPCETTLNDGDTPCPGGSSGNGFSDDLHGYDFVDDLPDPLDKSSLAHGSMVAGVVGAVTDNGLGIAGTSPEVSLLALKFARESKGLVADAAEAIRYAVLEGASVVNASFSTEGDDLHLRAALEAANEAGVLVVAAAATDDGTAKDLDDFGGYPCVYDLPNVLCVTVANEDHALASSWGATTVDLAAPGVNIRSTFLSPEYRKQVSASTSLAAPFVSGVAALILSHCQVSLAELRAGLLAGLPLSQPPGQQIVSGKRLNASLALATSCGEGPGPPQLLEP